VQIAVQDNGPGIDPDDQEIIFQRFRRIRQGARPQMGSGLGLHIVLRITREHGGRIEVDSQPGCGATFTVVLPRLSAEGAGPPSDPAVSNQSLPSATTD
jgi:two-component system OmpR family sensor kinase